MNAAYVVSLVQSVEHVFSTMLQCKVETQTPILQSAEDASHDVSGIIGLSGDVVGAIVLSFPMATAERVVSTFVGAEIDRNHEDFSDAVGELVNMIAGNAKAKFEGKHVTISCPSVIVGPGHQVFQQKDTAVIGIPCDCDHGQFSVNVSIDEANAAANRQAASA